jgi:hypothetical protein
VKQKPRGAISRALHVQGHGEGYVGTQAIIVGKSLWRNGHRAEHFQVWRMNVRLIEVNP